MSTVHCQEEGPTRQAFGKNPTNSQQLKIKGISKVVIDFMCYEHAKTAITPVTMAQTVTS